MNPVERIARDVVVLGGGPAGLAAALAARKAGASCVLVEREERLGGILKQCVHDGFGLRRFGEALTGTEYALRFSRLVPEAGIEALTGTFVHEVSRDRATGRFGLVALSPERGIFELEARALVLATGCRERSDRQVLIHGDRPAGVFTAGLAQRLVNVEGLLPGRRAVILGSGDIGLIMARRLTLEGMEVEGVYEIKPEPSGLARNVAQCLVDFGIPLHLATTVTEIHGRRRVESVTVAAVDERGGPIPGTERRVACDTLILSVGLIPENEVLQSLGVGLDSATKGPRVDQFGWTGVPGLFACGNAVHVNDLVDDVSDSGEIAGDAAARHALALSASEHAAETGGGAGVVAPAEAIPRDGAEAGGGTGAADRRVQLKAGSGFLYAVPQFIDPAAGGKVEIHFRSNATIREGAKVSLRLGDRVVARRSFRALRPPEAEHLVLDLDALGDTFEKGEAGAFVLELERTAPRTASSTAASPVAIAGEPADQGVMP